MGRRSAVFFHLDLTSSIPLEETMMQTKGKIACAVALGLVVTGSPALAGKERVTYATLDECLVEMANEPDRDMWDAWCAQDSYGRWYVTWTKSVRTRPVR